MLSSERRRYERHLTRLEASESWMQGQTLTLEQAADKLNGIAAVAPSRTRTIGS
jgi:hypothetical protein